LPHPIHKLAAEDGQTMAEYVVVLGVITLAIVTTFTAMSGSIQTVLERIVGLFS
jgi:Flp pilus assembly pilin Flp